MLFLLTALLMCVGFAGIVLPWVPGLLLMWLAALTFGIFGTFGALGAVLFGIITALVVIGEVLGFVLPGRAAGRAGAAPSSIVIGVVAAIVGFFVIPAFGFLIGGVLGIFLAEALRKGGTSEAWQTTLATIVGFGVGVLAQLGVALVVAVLWLVWVFDVGFS